GDFITPIVSDKNTQLYYVCAYVNDELRTEQNKRKYPDIKINERFCQIFNSKEELENLIYYGNNVPGIIVRQISNKPFYKFENNELQSTYHGNLFYKFIYRFEDTNPDEWIENPEIQFIESSNLITEMNYIITNNNWKKYI